MKRDLQAGVEKDPDAVFLQGFEFPPLSLRQLLSYPQPPEGAGFPDL